MTDALSAIGSIPVTDIKRRDFRNFYHALAKIDSSFAAHTQVKKDSFSRMRGFDKITGKLSDKGLRAVRSSMKKARLGKGATFGDLYARLLQGRNPDWAFKILLKTFR